jgi:capsular polysaccharide biosynthesis protein
MHDLIGGRLRLVDSYGVAPDTPIVVSKRLVGTRFFDELRRLPTLQERRWIVQQPDELVRSECIYFAQTNASAANWDHVRNVLQVPDSDATQRDKLFLTRRSAATRTLANGEEIEDLVRRYGFSVVDTSELGLREQVELFSNAGFVVGIHGAGLTNLVFRKNAPLTLLELFPAQASPNWYYFFLCRTYGFGYGAMIGTNTTTDSGIPRANHAFRVDPMRLERQIVRMLDPR